MPSNIYVENWWKCPDQMSLLWNYVEVTWIPTDLGWRERLQPKGEGENVTVTDAQVWKKDGA